jgi:hypothetical protein
MARTAASLSSGFLLHLNVGARDSGIMRIILFSVGSSELERGEPALFPVGDIPIQTILRVFEFASSVFL